MDHPKDPPSPSSSKEGFNDSLLSSLQPAPFQVSVQDLTIAAPAPQWTVPMAIPITVPRSIQRRLQKEENAIQKEIVRRVNLEVKAGEVLAM